MKAQWPFRLMRDLKDVDLEAKCLSWIAENARLREGKKEGRVRRCITVLGGEFCLSTASAALRLGHNRSGSTDTCLGGDGRSFETKRFVDDDAAGRRTGCKQRIIRFDEFILVGLALARAAHSTIRVTEGLSS